MIKEPNKPFDAEDMPETNQSEAVLGLKLMMEEMFNKGLFTAPIGHFEKGRKNHNLSPEYLWSYSRIIEMANLKPGSKALDAGGSGTPIDYYLAQKGIDVACVDQQKGLIDWSRETASKMGLKNIDFMQGDMAKNSFPDNYFDAVISVAVLQLLPVEIKIQAVKEFARVLKPGGILCLVIDFGKSTGGRGKYNGEYYDSRHNPYKNLKEIQEYIIDPSGLSLLGNQDLKDKFKVDKGLIRKAMRADFFSGKSLKRRLAFPYLFFKSPYFNYTFYSLFLTKKKLSKKN